MLLGSTQDKICTLSEDGCIGKIDHLLYDEESELFKACDCLPDCNYIEYYYEIINERMDYEYFSEYKKRGTVSVYFSDVEFLAYKRSMSFGIVSLLSNVGGLLGLFLGVSVLSIVETFYLLTLRLLNNGRENLSRLN